MKTRLVHIALTDSGQRHYVSCTVTVPGLGDIEMKDCVSTPTIEALFREVEVAADIKLRGSVSCATTPQQESGT